MRCRSAWSRALQRVVVLNDINRVLCRIRYRIPCESDLFVTGSCGNFGLNDCGNGSCLHIIGCGILRPLAVNISTNEECIFRAVSELGSCVCRVCKPCCEGFKCAVCVDKICSVLGSAVDSVPCEGRFTVAGYNRYNRDRFINFYIFLIC